MGSHALNVVRRRGSTALNRQKNRLRKILANKNKKLIELVDLSRNALLSVNNNDLTKVTNAHQVKAINSNPHANNVMSMKKLKQLRKRIVIRDKASGELKSLISANTMDA